MHVDLLHACLTAKTGAKVKLNEYSPTGEVSRLKAGKSKMIIYDNDTHKITIGANR